MTRPAVLTRHGEYRLARRLGVGKRAAAHAAEVALAQGTALAATRGRLRRYLDDRADPERPAHIVVHCGHVYVFALEQGPLITLWPLPGHLRQMKSVNGHGAHPYRIADEEAEG
jgi:hypothetical protein